MAAFVDQHHRAVRTGGWLDRLAALVAHELAPSSRRFWTALRLTTIATVGAALIVICHVNNELGTYLVWLVVGAGPMVSMRKATAILIAVALVLVSSVLIARLLAETPWLMLPFLFAFMALSTYLGVVCDCQDLGENEHAPAVPVIGREAGRPRGDRAMLSLIPTRLSSAID
jgi:hypothetical protein